MGSCVSSHKDPASVMKFRMSFGSKTDKLVIPSPIKDKPLTNGDGPIGELGLKPQPYPPTNFRDFGMILVYLLLYLIPLQIILCTVL